MHSECVFVKNEVQSLVLFLLTEYMISYIRSARQQPIQPRMRLYRRNLGEDAKTASDRHSQ